MTLEIMITTRGTKTKKKKINQRRGVSEKVLFSSCLRFSISMP
jgi:hypothetical protein